MPLQNFDSATAPLKLKVRLHRPDMIAPQKAHPADAGFDLTAMSVRQKTEDVFFLDTGVSVQAPEGWYVEVVPRSSIVKTDFILANSVGVIDPDYRGVIFVPFRYIGKGKGKGDGKGNGSVDGLKAAEDLIGKRIAQMIMRPLPQFEIETVDDLSDTARGEGGFGSSGH